MLLLIRDNLCENHEICQSDFVGYEQYDVGLMTMNMTKKSEYKNAVMALTNDIVDQYASLERENTQRAGLNNAPAKNEATN